MIDLLATALGLAFAFFVCLLTINAILGPWLRMRRLSSDQKQESETSPLHMF